MTRELLILVCCLRVSATIMLAYILGSICFGYYLIHFCTGKDIRELGTGNAGARNAGIVLGSWALFVTLALDLSKGIAAVLIPRCAGFNEVIVGSCAVMVVVGHIFPAQLRFRGGKGVATFVGTLAVLDIRFLFVLVVISLAMYLFIRSFTKAGLIGVAMMPIAALALHTTVESTFAVGIGSFLVLLVHHKVFADRFRKKVETPKAEQKLQFRMASESWEFEQIHKLNYDTFVEEIPQHQVNSRGMLKDKFHEQNSYAICVDGREVVGMLALRSDRPFSLDQKIGPIEPHLPLSSSVCELRLLAVKKSRRYGRVFRGILEVSAGYCAEHKHDLVVASGTTRQLALYKHIGLVPFGPRVGVPGALYQPMYGTVRDLCRDLSIASYSAEAAVHMMPGPVRPSTSVREALCALPVSHRSDAFMADFREAEQTLCRLTNCRYVNILSGSGTLANDAVAAQLSLLKGKGLLLSNGEFGGRLIDHAIRWQLDFEVIERSWGQSFDMGEIEHVLSLNDTAWVWCVHCETSTGMLNDLPQLTMLAQKYATRLCVDVVSSIGVVPVDLSAIYLASGSGNKGLCSLPGLALVFRNHQLDRSASLLPRYLDLSCYSDAQGVPYTISSNLVYALRAAIEGLDLQNRVFALHRLVASLRAGLRKLGFQIVCDDRCSSPAVTTVALPTSVSSERVGTFLASQGVFVSFNSAYLRTRNWIQFCLMGEQCDTGIDRVLKCMSTNLHQVSVSQVSVSGK